MNTKWTDELRTAELLPVGMALHRRYAIEGVIGRGTYGITYIGRDDTSGEPVAIREYFPYALADRAFENQTLSPKNKACGTLYFLGSDMFYRQHTALMDAQGSSNVVAVYDTFFENGTVYAVMELLEGATLERFLQLRRRLLSPEEAMTITTALADALLVVHSLNTLHFDINPRSIFLCANGPVKLIEFGAAKAGLRARHAVDDAEPWVDITAAGRTLCEGLTGRPVANDRISPHPNIPPQLYDLLLRMLHQDGARRFASVFEYRHALACLDIACVSPDVMPEDAVRPITQYDVHRTRTAPAPEEPARRTTAFDRALDRMGEAMAQEEPARDSGDRKRDSNQNVPIRLWIIFGLAAAVLVGTLFLLGIIR